MDPLSVTASIIAVLQLTSTLTSYIRDVRHATREQRKVAMEASNLNSLLTNLQYRVEDAQSSEPWFNQVRLLAIQGGPLDQFKEMLEKMVKQIQSSRKRDQIKSSLMWTFTQTEVENALNRMERLKSLIQCALTEDVFKLSQAIHGDVEALTTRVDQLHIQLQNHAYQDLQRRLEQWLGVPDPSINYRAALEKRHPKTGSWLVKGSQFNDWKSSECSLIWLHGNDTASGYFYFDFNDVEKQSSRKAIRSLLLQLAQGAANGLQSLEQMYHRYGSGQQQPPDDMIHSLLLDVMDQVQFKYIVVDALDECTDRDNLLMFVSKLADARLQGLRIMLVSRRELDIEEQLRPRADYSINIENPVVDEDIWVYVQHLLATDANLKAWPKSVQDDISSVIMKKANGMVALLSWVQLYNIDDPSTGRNLSLTSNDIAEPLYYAVSVDMVAVVKEILLQNIDIHTQGGRYGNALQAASESGNESMVQLLLEAGADVNAQGGLFNNALQTASVFGSEKIVQILLESGADVNAQGRDGIDALQQASMGGYEKVVQLLLDAGADINARGGEFHTALQAASLWGREEVVRMLIDVGAKVNARGGYHGSALHAASFKGQVKVVQILLEAGAEINVQGGSHGSPLQAASRWGREEVVQLLLEAGADVNTQRGKHRSALQAASLDGHDKVVQILLKAGADVNAEGYYGDALLGASFGGNEKVVQLLLEAGAEVKGPRGRYTLQGAIYEGHERIVQMLLDAGAEVKGPRGCDALQEAIYEGHERIVQMLLDAGAEEGEWGYTVASLWDEWTTV
ncbi:hypothetical protein DV736_g6069, partial [Chaetothyriales sp. CBS 134916]